MDMVSRLAWIALVTISVAGKAPSLIAQNDAGEPRIIREEIEWLDVWVPGNSNKTLPKVLLIGDSITRGYYGGVESALKGKAVVARLTTSKSLGDPGFLAEVNLILSQTKYDVVHFNNGLHGWGYTEKEYGAAFPDLIAAIKKGAPGAKMIWATTTPMRMPGKVDYQPNTERVKARNAIAKTITDKENIPTDDLFGFLSEKPEFWSGDGVHLNGQGNSALGKKVAEVIAPLLLPAR
jgi:lysophospholipase L1-like esterase